MTLKIIGGEYRGRSLRSVKGFMTRPLLGQVREALFNILGERIVDAEVWDLFAGTGASGLEALSRGARRVIFVEKGNQALTVLRENLRSLGGTALQRSHALRADAWDPPPMTPRGEDVEVPPDVVFLDPPYQKVAEDPVRAAWRAQQIAQRLAPGGVLCFHFQVGHLDVDDFDGEVEIREWGRTAIAFLERPGRRPRRAPLAESDADDDEQWDDVLAGEVADEIADDADDSEDDAFDDESDDVEDSALDDAADDDEPVDDEDDDYDDEPGERAGGADLL